MRPTTDRVREAVFWFLGGAVEGSVVLDLFAGTGAMAIESLSRGAAGAAVVSVPGAGLVVCIWACAATSATVSRPTLRI